MKFNGDAKRIKAKAVTFSKDPAQKPWEQDVVDEPMAEQNPDLEPSGENGDKNDPEAAAKLKKKNTTIGVVIGLLIAALLIGAFVYHNRSGKIGNADISTTTTTSKTQTTTRTYKTAQLTVHQDENGVWRSYYGLEKTVGYTGVVGNDTGWWYVENDVVNFNFTGIADNDYGSWFVRGGKVDTDYSGKVVYNGLMYRVENGKVTATEALTNKATTSTTSASTTTTGSSSSSTTGSDSKATTKVAVVITTVKSSSTCDHEHWVAIYTGDYIVQEGITHGSAVQCPDCGMLFENIELLKSHIYITDDHNVLPEDADYGGLDSKYVLTKEDVGSKNVVIGYTDGEVVYVCTECGIQTTNVDETTLIPE